MDAVNESVPAVAPNVQCTVASPVELVVLVAASTDPPAPTTAQVTVPLENGLPFWSVT